MEFLLEDTQGKLDYAQLTFLGSPITFDTVKEYTTTVVGIIILMLQEIFGVN